MSPTLTKPILLKGGRVIDPASDFDGVADLLIQNGKIEAIALPGKILPPPQTQIFDAKNLLVLPGLIDVHVHLREPGFEYKETIETGSKAALSGGFTSIACMANTNPVNDTPYVTAYIREKAKASTLCKIYPIGAVTKGLKGEDLAEIGSMVKEGARAISDDGMPVMNSYIMRKAMDYVKAFDVPIITHSEDQNLVGLGAMNEGALSNELGLRGNPAAAEEIMVSRDIALCRLTRSRLHIAHVTTKVALDHIRRAKKDGLPITTEVTPHHLTLSDDSIRSYDTNFKMAPPLRSKSDVEELRRALNEGVIDIIASDHAPQAIVEKAVEFDEAQNGIIGLQTSVPLTLALVRDGVLDIKRWVAAMTVAPAKLLGLDSGTLTVGKCADVTVIDPDAEWVFNSESILSKSNNSPFLGWKLRGKTKMTIIDGRIVFES